MAAYVGVKHCITCANGTDALTLALMVWNIGQRDAVFVPDFTFFASGEAPALEGATPVFVDVEEDTFNMSPDSLEDAILQVKKEGKLTPHVIVAVDLFGQPADYPKIRQITEKYDLLILEDGAVFTDHDEWAALLRSYRIHGKGTDKYDNVRIGMNSRLDTLQAAVLQVKLKAFEEYELEAVNKVADRYTKELTNVVKTPKIEENFYSSWAQYSILLKDEEQRNGLQAYLKEKGIPTMIYYPKPMSLQGAFAEMDCVKVDLSVTADLCQRVLALPMHPYMTEEEQEEVIREVKAYC